MNTSHEISNEKKINPSHSIEGNYIYNLSFQIVSILVPIITTPYLSRVLRPSGVGVYDYTNSIVSYFVLLGVMGLGTYGQLEIAKYKDDEKKRSSLFYEIMSVRAITHLVSIALFSFFILLCSERYKYIYLIQGVYVIASMIDLSWFFQGLENFKKIAIVNIFVKLSSLFFIFTLVKTKSDLCLYALIMSISTLLCNVCYFPFLRKYLGKPSLKIISLKKHLIGAVVFFVPSIASVIITCLDKTMLGVMIGSEDENGYYAQAYKIAIACFSLFSSLLIVMRSRMAYLSQKGDDKEFLRLLNKSLKFVSFLIFPLAFGMIAISDNFIIWFFGPGYDKVKQIIPFFSIWLIFKSYSNCLLEECIMATGKQKLFNITLWLGTISNVVLNILLIPKLMSIGASIASVIAEFIMLVLALAWCKKMITLKDIIKDSWKNLLIAIFISFFIFAIGSFMKSSILTICIQILVGGTTYCSILLITKDSLMTEFVKKITIKRPG